MTKRYFLFCGFIYACFSIKYINICFKNVNNDQEKVNVMVNEELAFFPGIINFKTVTLPDFDDPELKSKGDESKIFKKVHQLCDNPFVIDIDPNNAPFQTVTISVVYQPLNYPLEVFEVFLKQNFEENEFKLRGMRENLMMKVFLRYKKSHIGTPESKNEADFDYNAYNQLRQLRDGEIYCMSFYTRDFLGMLALSQNKFLESQLKQYYIFELDLLLPSEQFPRENEPYLVRIFPCQLSSFLQRKLQILVDPRATTLVIHLYGYINSLTFLNTYHFQRGKLVFDNKWNKLDFIDLAIIPKHPTQAIVDRKEHMLRYCHRTEKIICPMRLPENFGTLELSYVEITRFQDVILSMKGYYPDMSKKESKVFNIVPGRPSKADICVPQ